MSGWNWWDLFILCLAVYFVFRGCCRGFVGEVITLAGFIASFYFSFSRCGTFGSTLSASMKMNPYAAQALAVVLIWLGITMATAIVRMLMKCLIGAVHLGGVDKALGLCSGLFKSLVAVYVIMMGGLLLAPVTDPTWMGESEILRYAGRGWPQFRAMFIECGILPADTTLPDGKLEKILRPYRKGGEGPAGYNPSEGRT